MNYLFLHPTFPGQFHRLMERLAAMPGNRVMHCGHRSSLPSVPGVTKITYRLPPPKAAGHPYLQRLENATVQGLVVAEVVTDLIRKGFRPDVVYGYAGWGSLMFLKEILPGVPLLGYFEWFVDFEGGEYDFDPAYPLTDDQRKALRLQNAAMYLDLDACDAGITPTKWQQSRFPDVFRPKLSVIHDGVDVDQLQPDDVARNHPTLGDLDFGPGAEVVTYLARGFEPFRGFAQFMAAAARLQRLRPRCQIMVVGTDDVFYSRHAPDGKTYRQLALEMNEFDQSRLHFPGWLAPADYLRLLQISSVHVYLTRPFVLSWSLLEAMAAGCLVIGSRTPPVEEVIRSGENGLLVDFFDSEGLAGMLDQALENPAAYEPMRRAARRTVVEQYSQDEMWRRQAEWLHSTVENHSAKTPLK